MAKTRLRRLGERPKREGLRSLQRIRVQITPILFFERDCQGPTIQFAARLNVTHDGAKTGDEQYFGLFQSLHSISLICNQSRSGGGQTGDELSSCHTSEDKVAGAVTS